MLTNPIPAFDILRTGYYRHTNPVSQERTIETYIIELFRIKSGSMTIDGRGFMLVPDLLVCTRPGQRRWSTAPFECWFVHFTTDDPAFAKRFAAFPGVMAAEGGAEELIRIFGALRTEFMRADAHMAGLRLAELAAAIERCTAGTAARRMTPGEKAAVTAAEEFIRAHHGEKIKLSDIAAAVHLSPNYLHALFRRAVGETPAAQITRLRMERAAELLFTSRESIGSIAEQCGFESQAYFTSVFRKRYDITPGEYRERGIY
ncbi:MAG: helix-turn-helix transcriptional regulator [Clostridia bacterium]|nr:helix-turn-helix transcriptional regulator [Clostridia bacterium]